MGDEGAVEGQVKIEKPATANQNRVVPSAPQDHTPPKPVPVGNPLLVTATPAATVPTACAKCGAPVHRKPATVPFKGGPHRGGFFCRDCWILEWAENPDIASDETTRQWMAEESRRIRMRRAGGSDVLYSDGTNKAYLTPRGTVLIDLKRLPFSGADEYDSDRFKTLLAMFQAIADKRVAGYGTVLGQPEKEPEPEPEPAPEPKKSSPVEDPPPPPHD